MPTIQAQTLVDKSATILQDVTNIRWPASELLGWLNDGQREIALYKPNACVKNQSVQLSSGTKQALPSDGITLTDVVRNMGTTGTTPGNSVRIVSREILDAQVPDWHTQTASTVVKHYIYSEQDPKTYYVYPASTGTNYVEIIYCASPANATLGGVISVDDIYASALVDYILYRAYSKDTEYAANKELAAAHFQAFSISLTGKAAAEAGSDPNARTAGNRGVTR